MGGLMGERAAYSRVYWSIVDDPKFVTIYDDDRHLACWLRLLLIADQAHPSSAHLPAGVRAASVKALQEVGLVDVSGSRYRIRGLDAERERRRLSSTTRGPNGSPTVTGRSPDGIQTQGLRRDETRRDKTSTARESLSGDDERADLEAFLLLTRRPPTARQRQLLDGIADRHDLTGPQWAADIMLRHPDDPIGAVIEADKAWRAERIAEARTREKPTPKPRRPRGLPQSTRELLDHWAATAGSATREDIA